MSDTVENVLTRSELESALTKNHQEITNLVKKAEEEASNAGSVAKETKAALEAIVEKAKDIGDRLSDLEKKGHNPETEKRESLGEMFVKSEAYAAMKEGRQSKASINVKTAIINATGASQPLVQADRLPGIYKDPDRRLMIRDLLPTGATGSNNIEFARENVFTNSAGPQVGGSPEAFENVAKPESGITFTLANEPVQTLAHFIPASKQVLDDAPMLQSYINSRLTYGLKLYEEDQLLNGTGTNGELNGLITQATSYTPRSPDLTVNEIDKIRDAIRQAHASEYMPTAVVLNPADWYDIEITKVNSGTDDRYIMGDPASVLAPRIWGLPVVATNSIAAGTFLVGSFNIGAQIWDRMQSTVEVSREHSDNFIKNMVTILAEERIALTVYRTQAFITGNL